MFGLPQIEDQLPVIQTPDEQWKWLLDLVSAHHNLTIGRDEQTVEVAILAHFEQEHVVGPCGVARDCGGHLIRIGHVHLHENDAEAIACQ